jgi:hypothetical protein
MLRLIFHIAQIYEEISKSLVMRKTNNQSGPVKQSPADPHFIYTSLRESQMMYSAVFMRHYR